MESDNQFSFGSVLIVDDSEIDVLVNRRLIEITKFAKQVVITHNGEQALNYLNQCKSEESIPDWIFLDLHLPVMSGFEFLEKFKKVSDTIRHKSRIVILSVIQKQETKDELLKNEYVFGQINKPLTQALLHDLAKAHVSASS
jgi:CheY-like chemotaxis protein